MVPLPLGHGRAAARTDAPVLDLFDRLGVRASLFILGEVASFYPDLAREIAARGHQVGCHGFHHVDIDLLGPEGFARELARDRAAFDPLLALPRDRLSRAQPAAARRDDPDPARAGLPLRRVSLHLALSARQGSGRLNRSRNRYGLAATWSLPKSDEDMVEIPLPTFPLLRLPATTGILTRIAGTTWTLLALRTGDVQHYFHRGRRSSWLGASGCSCAGSVRGWSARSNRSRCDCRPGARAS